MRGCLAALLAALFLLSAALSLSEDFRMPAPAELTPAEEAAIRERGSLERSPWLDAAMSLLEEGNPFLVRYDLLTGADVRPRLPFGVPYLFGGQTPSHVFAREPDYVVQASWSSSPSWYVKGLKYLYGFDCVGYMRWVWAEVTPEAWPTCDGMLLDTERHVLDMGSLMPDWEAVARLLRPGDLLVLRHPYNHVAMYAGTLRAYGYAEEDAPELAPYLDFPLVIHSTTNAFIARRFAWLIRNGLPKYRVATVTDGGVCVSLLGVPAAAVPGHVFEQNQDTRYFELPDGTWLTVLLWEHVRDYCWWRAP